MDKKALKHMLEDMKAEEEQQAQLQADNETLRAEGRRLREALEQLHQVVFVTESIESVMEEARHATDALAQSPAIAAEVERVRGLEEALAGLKSLLVDLWGAASFKNRMQPGLADRYVEKLQVLAAIEGGE